MSQYTMEHRYRAIPTDFVVAVAIAAVSSTRTCLGTLGESSASPLIHITVHQPSGAYTDQTESVPDTTTLTTSW